MLLLKCKVVRLFMMNKKGFTLVEILVSIGLLALLGSVIAISLNKVFKDNNI